MHNYHRASIVCLIRVSIVISAVASGGLAHAAEASTAYEKTLNVLRARQGLSTTRATLAAARAQDPTVSAQTKSMIALEKNQSEALAAATQAEPDIISDEILTMLRSKGFGVTGGYGHLTRTGTNLGLLQLRFNAIQQTTTTRVNRANREDPLKQAPFGALRKLSQFANLSAVTPEQQLANNSDLPRSSSFLSGVYVWGGYTTKEIAFGTEKARPLFAGISLGFGPIDRGASAVHVDAGLAFYGNGKMPKDDFYLGLSIDWELFKKLVKSI